LKGSAVFSKEFPANNEVVSMNIYRKDKKLSSISIAQFTVDSKSSKELQQYLSNIVSHCEQASDRLPSVIVIDNLHLADNLSKAFSGFFSLDSHLW